MDDTLFRELFTDHVDVVFAFHGYPGAIHQLVHGRPDADRFHVRGFIEEGTTTTPFDMVVRNRASRYHLVMDAINNARRTPPGASDLKAWCQEQLAEHRGVRRRAPRGHARGPRLDARRLTWCRSGRHGSLVRSGSDFEPCPWRRIPGEGLEEDHLRSHP